MSSLKKKLHENFQRDFSLIVTLCLLKMFDVNVFEEISPNATMITPIFLLFYVVDIDYRTEKNDDDGLIRLNFVATILYRVFIYSL